MAEQDSKAHPNRVGEDVPDDSSDSGSSSSINSAFDDSDDDRLQAQTSFAGLGNGDGGSTASSSKHQWMKVTPVSRSIRVGQDFQAQLPAIQTPRQYAHQHTQPAVHSNGRTNPSGASEPVADVSPRQASAASNEDEITDREEVISPSAQGQRPKEDDHEVKRRKTDR